MSAKWKRQLVTAAALTLAVLTLWMEFRQPPEPGRLEDTAVRISTTLQPQAEYTP